MKILIGINSLSSGGAEVFATEIAVAYSRMGNDVSLVTYLGVLNDKGGNLKNSLLNNNVQVIDLSFKPKFLLLFYYFKIILTLKPQIIHSNLEQTDLLLLLTKVITKNSIYIRTLHNIKPFNRYPLWLHRLLFKYYDKNIGCGNYIKSHFGISSLKQNIVTINNGVDMNRIIQNQTSHDLAKDLDETVFIVIGTSQKRFGEYQKGHDLIFKAFKNIDEKYRVIFVGDIDNIDYDFPEEKQNSRYEFVGVVTDISTHLMRSDYVLAASRFEGLPLSTIEGVCSGLPLICSNIDGFKPFDRESTLSFKTEDVSDLVKKIEIAIQKRKEYRILGIKNKKLYMDQFDINVVASKYLSLL